VKPDLVIQGDFPAWAALGDGKLPWPRRSQCSTPPTGGGVGRARRAWGVDFVSDLTAQGRVRRRVRTGRPLAALPDTDLPLNRRYFLM
jgi:hypothetical protein